MSDVTIVVNGIPRRVPEHSTVAAALLQHGPTAFRRSVGGAPRAPLCGMGTCHECRVTINGLESVRACLEPVREGLQVETAR